MSWTIQESVNYECACDAINFVAGMFSEALEIERARDLPDEDRINRMRAARLGLVSERRALSVLDQDGVRAAIQRYTPFCREYRLPEF